MIKNKNSPHKDFLVGVSDFQNIPTVQPDGFTVLRKDSTRKSHTYEIITEIIHQICFFVKDFYNFSTIFSIYSLS